MATINIPYSNYIIPNGDGTYYIYGSKPSVEALPVTDVDDGNGDDLTILGDVSTGDTMASFDNGNVYEGTYLAATQNGFIFERYGLHYVYSTVQYTGSETIVALDQPYAICFGAGTRIETLNGPVAIETLVAGDVVVTASCAERPIIWVGCRTLDCSGENAHMAPVRVRANAFGAGVPQRDVLLSPGHPVLVKQNGVEILVPIMNLINGTTIERTSMQSVTYWHIELDEHDVLIADGLPAESFFDMGSRGWFDDDLDDVLANPDLVPTGQHSRCRAVAIDGPLVEAERKRLADLFYADLSVQCVWPSAGEYAVL